MSVGYLSFGVRSSAFRYFCWLALPPCRAATQGNQQKTLRRVLVFCVFALSCAVTQGKLPKTLRRVLECTSMDCEKLSTI